MACVDPRLRPRKPRKPEAGGIAISIFSRCLEGHGRQGRRQEGVFGKGLGSALTGAGDAFGRLAGIVSRSLSNPVGSLAVQDGPDCPVLRVAEDEPVVGSVGFGRLNFEDLVASYLTVLGLAHQPGIPIGWY